jgi:shikimate dehydrogenase
MNIYGLIGYPLSHSFSRKYFLDKFEKENIRNTDFQLFELKDLSGFRDFVSDQKNLKGLGVTIPYKKAVMGLLDEVDPVAEKIGAVNCIKISRTNNKLFLKGYNTDAYGFETSIKPLLKPSHNNALILGTGGASLAVAFVLENLGIEYLFVSRNPFGCKHIRYEIINERMMRDCKLIINTTPIGMFPNTEEKPNIPYEHITTEHLLFDLTYNPEITSFMKMGQQAGAVIKNGYEMLCLQAEKAWGIWGGE